MVQVPIADIIVPEGRRPLDQAKVAEIAASIKVVGLLSPIGVRGRLSLIDGSSTSVLVHGRHRLEACRSLGWKEIEAIKSNDVVPESVRLDGTTFKMMEIAENLDRAELTTQQRNEHLAAWVALLESLATDIGAAPPISKKPGRKPSAAIAEVAKESGVGLKTVKEAVAASKVLPEVKAAADKAELTSKQRLAISRLPKAKQLDAVAEQVAARPSRSPPTEPVTYDDVRKHRAMLNQLQIFLKVFLALEKLGDATQAAEAVALLDVDSKTLPHLRRVAEYTAAMALRALPRPKAAAT